MTREERKEWDRRYEQALGVRVKGACRMPDRYEATVDGLGVHVMTYRQMLKLKLTYPKRLKK